MGINLKSSRYSVWFKLFAVMLGIAGIAVFYAGMLRAYDFEYAVQSSDYTKSGQFRNEVYNIQTEIVQLWEQGNLFPGQKGYLTDTELSEAGDKVNRARQMKEEQQAKAERESVSTEEKRALAESLLAEARQLEEEAGLREGSTNSQNEPTMENSTDNLPTIKDSVPLSETGNEPAANPEITTENYEDAPDYYGMLSMRQHLGSIKGLQYSVVSDNALYGHNAEYYNGLPYAQSLKEGTATTVIHYGFEKDVFLHRVEDFSTKRQNGLTGIYLACGGLLMSLAGLLWMMYTAGRTRREEGVVLNRFDSIAYLDVTLGVAVILFLLAATGWVNVMGSNYVGLSENRWQGYMDITLLSIVSIALLSAAYFIAMIYLVTLSKRFKRCEIFKHTIICQLCFVIFRLLKRLFAGARALLDEGPITGKVAVFLFAYSIVSTFTCIFFVIIGRTSGAAGVFAAIIAYIVITAFAIRFLTKRIAGFTTLAAGVRIIKNGNLDFKIPACGSHTMDNAIDDINNISAGLKAAVDNEMSAERMKVELITNVSHDLRTPLTSIITYSDLISAEDIAPEQVREYSAIIRAKSDKLKLLVDDLFEVSKAQSGTMPLELQALSLNDLLTQSVAEYQEGLENNRLELKVTAPHDKVSITADGARMWRVLSNIFSNIVKYSMPGTRVYVDIETSERNASVVFRNISSSPMNFKSEEIFERFIRGDESRSGEGSGLGLAIVKSFMDIQKGDCSIIIDGDLFKINLTMPLA